MTEAKTVFPINSADVLAPGAAASIRLLSLDLPICWAISVGCTTISRS